MSKQKPDNAALPPTAPTKAAPPAVLPAAPQPTSLEIRETASRTLGNLLECLVDHIVLFHKSEDTAMAALAFSLKTLQSRVRERMKLQFRIERKE